MDAAAQKKANDAHIRKSARMGHLEELRRLLAQAVHLGVDALGQSALGWAALEGQTECARELLAFCDPEARNNQGWRPIDTAAIAGHADCVSLLLSCSDLAAANKKCGSTALALAISCHHMDCARLLLAAHKPPRGSEPSARAMIAAAQAGEDFVCLLLPWVAAGAAGARGETPLMAAAGSGNAQTTAKLLPLGDPMAVDGQGWTALMRAASKSEEAVRALAPLSDPKAANANGATALMIAANAGQADCVKFLLPLSDPTAENLSGHTAFHLAQMSGHAEAADLLAFCAPKNEMLDALREFGREKMPRAWAIKEAADLGQSLEAGTPAQAAKRGARLL